MESFSEGLRRFFTRGACVSPVRLNKRMKQILLSLIDESLENTSVDFSEDEDELYDRFMQAMTWLKKQITGESVHSIRFTKRIGLTITYWVHDNRFHNFSEQQDFENALQWVINKINKRYSQAELVKED